MRAVLFDAGNTLLHLDHAFIAGVLAAAGHPRLALDIRVAEYAAKAAIFTLGVVSNADGRVEHDLGRRGLGGHFATVVDSHVVGVEKPARGIFDLALARLDVPAEHALYVGDVFAVDVQRARGAGMPGVLLDPLGRYPGPVDCPRIRRLAELLDLLPARAAP